MSGDVDVTPARQVVVLPEKTSGGSPRSRAVALAAGIGVCAVGAAIAIGIGRLLPAVNPMLIAIALGTVVGNLIPVPARIRPGVDFSTKRLLRLGIAVLGLQLMFHDILALGWEVIALVAVIVVAGITARCTWVGSSGCPGRNESSSRVDSRSVAPRRWLRPTASSMRRTGRWSRRSHWSSSSAL